MATLKELEAAFIKADDLAQQGDETARQDAAAFASELKKLRSAPLPGTETVTVEETISDPAATRAAESARGGNMMAFQTQAQRNENSDSIVSATGYARGSGIRGGSAAIGQALGAKTGLFAPVMIPVLGSIFGMGGEMVAGSLEGEFPSGGKILRAGITSAIPGANLIKTPARQMAGQVGGAVLGSETESLVDRGELNIVDAAASAGLSAVGQKISDKFGRTTTPKPTALDNERTMMAENFTDLRKSDGIVIPPFMLGRGSDTLASDAGKAAITQAAAIKNAPKFQAIIREEIGLPKDSFPIAVRDKTGKLDVKAQFEKLRADQYEPYQTIGKINASAQDELAALRRSTSSSQELEAMLGSPEGQRIVVQAKADVDALKKVREAAADAYDSFKESGNPDARALWKAQLKAAEALEDNIDQAATLAGDDKLLERLRQSRKKIAQSYSVQNATSRSTGIVDPGELAKMYEFGAPLTGGLERVARFANSFNKAAAELSGVPAPGVGNLNSMGAMSQFSRGNAAGAAGGLATRYGGALPRAFLLSDTVQGKMLTAQERRDLASEIIRLASTQAPGSDEEQP